MASGEGMGAAAVDLLKHGERVITPGNEVAYVKRVDHTFGIAVCSYVSGQEVELRIGWVTRWPAGTERPVMVVRRGGR